MGKSNALGGIGIRELTGQGVEHLEKTAGVDMDAWTIRNTGTGDECGAPWNLDDDGECECGRCSKLERDIARADFLYDEYKERHG